MSLSRGGQETTLGLEDFAKQEEEAASCSEVFAFEGTCSFLVGPMPDLPRRLHHYFGVGS